VQLEERFKMLATINEILSRGNTAEIKKTKDGIIILEVKRKIKLTDDEIRTESNHHSN
jgi:hypothetical protein